MVSLVNITILIYNTQVTLTKIQKKGDYIVSYAISKRIKRGWLVVILAPAAISSAGDIYTTRKYRKSQPFFLKKIHFLNILFFLN